MQQFTPFEYLAIDIANQYGHDKLVYVDRINWVIDNINQLEDLTDDVDMKERPRYIKAVMVLRDAQAGKPSGHPVGFDAVCSGMQIMSALTGCESGMKATGLINTGKRPDAYTQVTQVMGRILGYPVPNGRRGVKNAVMTRLYGSTMEPIKEFGEDTPELEAFHEALKEVAPGAVQLLSDLIQTWNPNTDAHEWLLPDGHLARCPVMDTVQHKLEIDELGHSTMLWQGKRQCTKPFSVSNAANIIHSVDGYILRCLERELNWSACIMESAIATISSELVRRALNNSSMPLTCKNQDLMTNAHHRYLVCKIPDLAVLQYLTENNVQLLSHNHLEELIEMINWSVQGKPFPMLTNHDEIKCHPNNMQRLREGYNRVMVRLHRSELLTDIFQQMMGGKGRYSKYSNKDFTAAIIEADYPIC